MGEEVFMARASPSLLNSTMGKSAPRRLVEWTRRVRIGRAPLERELNVNRKSALEISVRAFAEKRDGAVVNPVVGTSFDSLGETSRGLFSAPSSKLSSTSTCREVA